MRKIIYWGLMLLICVNFFYVVSGVINEPIKSIDVISIWLYKAKGFYFENGDVFGFLSNLKYSHPQYPILMPFIYYQIFKVIGSVNEIYILGIYPFLYLLTLFLSFRTMVLLKCNNILSLTFTYIYSMFPPLLAMGGRFHAGEADIFIIIAYWFVIIFSYKYIHDKKWKWLFLITFATAIVSNIKMEGLFLSMVFFILPIPKRKKLIFTILSSVPFAVWSLVRIESGIVSDLGFIFPGFDIFNRIYLITVITLKEMVKINNWYIFWLVFAFGLFIKGNAVNFIKIFIQPLLILLIIMYFANYTFSSISPEVYVPSSIDRVLMQLSPLYFTIFAKHTIQIASKI
jgi:hypothetical protein